jgi:hypothetical protein
MSWATRPLTPARRDAGLRRLRALNRLLIGAAVVATGLFTDVAANAFPGHKRAARSTVATPAATNASPRRPRGHARPHRHVSHHPLAAPAQTPSAAVAAPAPLVSGGS